MYVCVWLHVLLSLAHARHFTTVTYATNNTYIYCTNIHTSMHCQSAVFKIFLSLLNRSTENCQKLGSCLHFSFILTKKFGEFY